MFEVFDNHDGESLYICNSRYGLNQCMDELERQGKEVSYRPVNMSFDYPERLAAIPRWQEI